MGDVTEPSQAPEFRAGRLCLDAGAGGQDGHLHGLWLAEDAVLGRCGLDVRDGVAVLDPGLLGSLHVAALRGIRGQDLGGMLSVRSVVMNRMRSVAA
ncbi:hypothetical protein [Streptomyces sp. SID12488]|uniref:hypothetical protein n=1 Tax=Streptomyces sp. SID12488 TaxID=2706040 RepID=UPI0013D9AF94|nr:hypothetical protein [Streptomyces sp. SID12488]